MVRINLIDPKFLTDQHLIAEYNEILMLFGYVQRYPEPKGIADEYILGPGHIKFFKNKLVYLQKRHEHIKREMKKRKFATNKRVSLRKFKKELKHDWKAKPRDVQLIKKRLTEKIELKPDYYRYYREHKSKKFLLDLIRNATQ